MKKITTILTLLLLAVAGAWGATTTFTIDAANGQFYNSSGSERTWTEGNALYGNKWVSTATSPQLTLSCGGNNMVIDAQFRIHTDSYTLSVSDGYVITGYSISAYTNYTGGTSTIGGTTISTDAANPTVITVTDLGYQTASFAVSTENPWIIINSFTVTVEEQTITSVADLDANTAYAIATAERGSWIVPNEATQLTSTTNASASVNTGSANQQFAFVKSGEKYYLYSISANRFVAKEGNYTRLGFNATDDATLLASEGSTDYPVVVALQDGAYQMGVSNGYNPAVITSWNDRADEGNRAKLQAAGSFDPTVPQKIIENPFTPIIDLSSLSDGKYYLVSTLRGVWNSTTSALSAKNIALDRDNAELKMAIIPFNGKNFLYSINAGKFITSSALNENPEPVNITATGDALYPWFFSFDSSHNINVSNGGYLIDTWGTLDNGNRCAILEAGDYDLSEALAKIQEAYSVNITYKVVDGEGNVLAEATDAVANGEEVSDIPAELKRAYTSYEITPITADKDAAENVLTAVATFNLPFETSDDYANAKWYYMTLRGYWVLYSETTPWYFTDTQSKADEAQWAYIGNPYTGFQIINKAAGNGKFLKSNGNGGSDYPTMETEGTAWMLGEHPVDGSTFYFGENNHLYAGSNNGYYLRVLTATLTSSNDGVKGGSFTFEAVPDNFNEFVKENVKPYFDTMGQYFSLASTAENINYANNTYAPALENCSQETYQELLAFVQNPENIRYPETGYYRIVNPTRGNRYVGMETETPATFDTNTSLSTIVKLEGEKGTYKIMLQDKYLDAPVLSTLMTTSTEGATFTTEIASPGFIGIKSNGAYVHAGNSGNNFNLMGYYSPADDEASGWKIEDATSATVALNGPVDGSYYATFYAPFDATIEGADAYTVAVDGSNAVTTQVEGNKVAAGTAVLLKGADAEATVTINSGEALAAQTSALAGTYLDMDVDGATDYFFGKNNDKVGFYHWTGTTLKANRAYLPASAVNANETKGLAINWNGDADGINAVATDNVGEQTVFDLQGRRVNKTQRGLYIVNGKKVVVK